MKRLAWCLVLLVLLAAVPAWAYDGPVEKKAFAMPSYTTAGGQTIKNVRVGYETYGTFNAAKDNVILLTHGFSGNSHHAGKYKPTDAAPGYWGSLEEGLKDVKAKVLLLPAGSDLLLFPAYSKRAFDILKAQGKAALYHEIPGDGGHLDGAFAIGQAGEVIRKFLAE